MSDTWVTDMTHYLDVFDLSLGLPAPARRLAAFFGQIVSAATAMDLLPGDYRDSALRCRRMPGRKPCPGFLLLGMKAEPHAIQWGCFWCKDQGIIHHFEGTPWDLGLAPGQPHPERKLRLWLPEPDFQPLLGLSFLDRDAERAVRSAEMNGDGPGVTLGASVEAFEELADELASHLNERPKLGKRGEWAALDRDYTELAEMLRHHHEHDQVVQRFQKRSAPHHP